MIHWRLLATSCIFLLSITCLVAADQLTVHGIFKNNMVIQRGKPITVWGWAPADTKVSVTLGQVSENGVASGEKGRWEVTFPPQVENAVGQTLRVQAGDAVKEMTNILIGDVWVMNGQSNMAFGLKAVYQGDFEASMAHLPQLRYIKIQSGAESEYVEINMNEKFVNGDDTDKNWKVVTPEVALDMGAIGYVFGSRLQRSLQIPIGIIDTARGGASIESLVPRHKFADHPDAAEYLKWVDARRAEFDEDAFRKAQMDKYLAAQEKYDQQIAADKAKGVQVKRKKPEKPNGEIRTWSVPGRSPSDAAACYNGMFGVFKGFNITGVAFHQGFNNSMMNTSCKPKFYRVLMKLMVDGWREDFNDPKLPVAIIDLCAGGTAQNASNFEVEGLSTAAFIREAQRLGLADCADTANTVFIPSYDQKIPQLHTKKKVELGFRAACWALTQIYKKDIIEWDTAPHMTTEVKDGTIVLTFDKPVRPDDYSSHIEGFSIADKSGIFYMANAEVVETKDKALQNKQFVISSPLVKEPLAIRYAWARAPLGNLKINGMPWLPLPSFRTDTFDWPAEVTHMDPEGSAKNSVIIKELKAQAEEALRTRLGPKQEK